MFCKNCGHELKESAKFCASCGWAVSTEELSDAHDNQTQVTEDKVTTIDPKPAERIPAAPKPVKVQSGEKKSLPITTIVIAILAAVVVLLGVLIIILAADSCSADKPSDEEISSYVDDAEDEYWVTSETAILSPSDGDWYYEDDYVIDVSSTDAWW